MWKNSIKYRCVYFWCFIVFLTILFAYESSTKIIKLVNNLEKNIFSPRNKTYECIKKDIYNIMLQLFEIESRVYDALKFSRKLYGTLSVIWYEYWVFYFFILIKDNYCQIFRVLKILTYVRIYFMI